MWNLEKWYRWTCLQGRNKRPRCREQAYGHQGGKWREGGCVINWEIGIDIYTLICIKWITNKNLLYKKLNKIKFKNSIKNIDTFQLPILKISSFYCIGSQYILLYYNLFLFNKWICNIKNKKMVTRFIWLKL